MTPQDQFALFCQRAKELADRKLLNSGWAPEMSMQFSAARKMLQLTTTEPDEDHLRSFLTVFRLFTMQGEPTYLFTIHNLAQRAIRSDAYKEQLREARELWKKDLAKGGFEIEMTGKGITPEHVYDLWINGHYFHNDQRKRQELAQLIGPAQQINRMMFLNLLVSGAQQVFYVGRVLDLSLRQGLA